MTSIEKKTSSLDDTAWWSAAAQKEGKARVRTMLKTPLVLWRSSKPKWRHSPPHLRNWLLPLGLPMLLAIQPFSASDCNPLVVLFVAFVFAAVLLRLVYRRVRHPQFCSSCASHDGGDVVWALSRVPWRVRLCRSLPIRLVSRHVGRLTEVALPRWLALVVVWLYAKFFGCAVHEASPDRLSAYPSLSAFFCRRLKPGLRPVCATSEVVSPADGTVTFAGPFEGGFLEQVKGVHYSLGFFLGLRRDGEAQMHAFCDRQLLDERVLHHKDGSTRLFQWVVYLAPGDYHRFHSPADWTVELRRHFSGDLLSVQPYVSSCIPGLLHLNERVAWLGRWRHGFFSVTAVGAANVGSIHAETFDPDLRTNQATSVRRECTIMHACSKRSIYFRERAFEGGVPMARGQEFGHFSFGSTIVVLFEAPADFAFHPHSKDGHSRVKVGQGLFSRTHLSEEES